MSLNTIDISIIFGYIALTIFIGFWVSTRASKNIQAYFLGGNQLKWYWLGLSNSSGMFDISGTAWTIAILFIYGLKSVWIPWLWPVWNQIFIMIFLAAWLRRSNVMTGAEWITYRFGNDKGSKLSHIIVVIFAIISAIGFIAYFFKGIGDFATVIFPWDLSIGSLGSPQVYAIIIFILSTLYVIKGGMYSVVATEVLQFLIMTVACILVAIFAMNEVSPEMLHEHIPNGWTDFMNGLFSEYKWDDKFAAINAKIDSDGFGMLGALLMMMIFKGLFASLAGPVPSYDMQRVLSCRTAKEAAKMSGFTSLVLFPVRYLMIAGIGILGIAYFLPELKGLMTSSGSVDFELVLPEIILSKLPVGVKGIMLAGLLAAFMSTFSAFVNAAPAYVVNDIYKKYINPNASDKKYVKISYISSISLVFVGIMFGLVADSINTLTLWITSSLYGGYAAANVLKWIWGRFNGYGYFYGMLAGLIGSTFKFFIFPDMADIYVFPYILGFSFLGSILGCLLTKPTEDSVAIKFFKDVRPWGFWGSVYKKAKVQHPEIKKNGDFLMDSFNVIVGIVWQMTLVLMPIFLVIREYNSLLYAFIGFAITTVLLKFTWYNNVKEKPDDIK